MTMIINLFAGPGTGKSTVGADLFAEMKWRGYNVELIDEYAKQMTWEKHTNILQDQLYVTAKQNRKLQRLVGQVDYVITDSPLIMCFPYADHCDPCFKPLVRAQFNSYDNINFFLIRAKAYNPIGRNQTYEEACALDNQIKQLLIDEGLPHIDVKADRAAKKLILEYVQSARN